MQLAEGQIQKTNLHGTPSKLEIRIEGLGPWRKSAYPAVFKQYERARYTSLGAIQHRMNLERPAMVHAGWGAEHGSAWCSVRGAVIAACSRAPDRRTLM